MVQVTAHCGWKTDFSALRLLPLAAAGSLWHWAPGLEKLGLAGMSQDVEQWLLSSALV